MDLVGPQNVRGRVRAHEVSDNGVWTPKTEFKSNLLLNQWATIVAKLLTTGDARYRIGGMYLEFSNTASPGDPVSPPAFDRSRDINYYNDLAGSSNRDYLRVPMTGNQLLTDGADFKDNEIVFFARSSGTTGVHGKAFSDSVNSTIFGASLVAYVDNNDATRDLLLSSMYLKVADQQQKLSTSQIGLEWQLIFQ